MSGTKIKSLAELKKILVGLKKKGKRVVFTNGCFDILHYGHVMYLEASKKKGDILIVAVNNDASVKRIKGLKRPLVKEKDRANIIAALESVNYVVIFSEDTPLEIIKKLKPDILIKGSDWTDKPIVGADFVKASGGKVAVIKLAKGRSTTGIIRKIIETF